MPKPNSKHSRQPRVRGLTFWLDLATDVVLLYVVTVFVLAFAVWLST